MSEFIMDLTEKLNKNVLRTVLYSTIAVNECEVCQNKGDPSVSPSQFLSLEWNLTKEQWAEGKVSLHELITTTWTQSNIQCDCTTCKQRTMQKRLTSMKTSPESLIFFINRKSTIEHDVADARYFEDVFDDGFSYLINLNVTFPKELRMTMVDETGETEVIYLLKGIIILVLQSRNPAKCHYLCDCLNENNKWIRYDDYLTKNSDSMNDKQDFESTTACAFFYKKMISVN